MNYTITLVNNRPICFVRTLDNKRFQLKESELYELIKTIDDDNRFKQHNDNSNNLFIKHTKYNITVLFKNYDELYTPLLKLYNKYTKEEILEDIDEYLDEEDRIYTNEETKDGKIKAFKTKAAAVVIASSIVTAALANNLGIEIKNISNINNYKTQTESLFEPTEEHGLKVGANKITIESNENALINDSEKEYSDEVVEEVRLTEPTPMVSNENVVDLSDELTIEPREIYYESAVDVPQFEINVDANYSQGINDRTDPYKEDIEKYGMRRGVSPDLVYDIVSQEYGGTGNNLMHVVFDSWKDQVVTSFNFDTNRLEKIVLTDNPDKYIGKVDIVITRSDLKNYKTNLAVGTILLQYSLSQFDYNIPLGIQAYNNGVGAVNQIISETTRRTGMSRDQILETNNPVWLDYTSVIEQGDQKYFKNVVKHINEDQIDSKTNDVYSVQYIEDGELQTNEVQFKLR